MNALLAREAATDSNVANAETNKAKIRFLLETSWTPIRVKMLMDFAAMGLDAPSMREQAVAIFGTENARNAIAGKMHRLGLCKKFTPEQRAAKRGTVEKANNQKRQQQQKPGVKSGPPMDFVPFEPCPSEVLMPPDTSFLCTMDNLQPDMCRAPLGDPSSPEFRYCGCPGKPPGPYCDFHYNFFYQPGTATGDIAARPHLVVEAREKPQSVKDDFNELSFHG